MKYCKFMMKPCQFLLIRLFDNVFACNSLCICNCLSVSVSVSVCLSVSLSLSLSLTHTHTHTHTHTYAYLTQTNVYMEIYWQMVIVDNV